nr:DUF4230 domain-containing protein [uncultured Mediterraneibacter sp.]
MKKMRVNNDDSDIAERVTEMPVYVKRIIKYTIIVVISLLIGGICGWRLNNYLNKEEISTDYISAKLEDVSELTTQKITYSARVPVDKGSIPFINKRGFIMEYNATLRAGVNMEEVDVKQRGNTIIVKIPHAKVLDKPNLDPDSIKFYDETKALFNWSKHEDVAEAIAQAKEDIESNPSIDISMLLTRADENAEELIHTLLDDSVKGCDVEVKFIKDSTTADTN